MADLFDLSAQQPRFDERHRKPPPRGAKNSHPPTLPSAESISAAEARLPDPLSCSYLARNSPENVAHHIVTDLVPAMSGQAHSARYYGFVTGGVLPIAEWADNVVSRMDQNVQVHLPSQSIATKVEQAALDMLVRLLWLDRDGREVSHGDEGVKGCAGHGERVDISWAGKTFTTGATASNILGLACAREAILERRLPGVSVADVGLVQACLDARVREIRVLTSAPHSSLLKAASVIGLGRASVVDVSKHGRPWKIDLDAVERELQREGVVSVIAVSGGEVNTGRYALDNIGEWFRLRRMADRHGAWIHLDGAFGIFSRALWNSRPEYRLLCERTEGFYLADSIALDGHKILNVPYDCGIFLTRSASLLQSVFQNPNAAYLSPTGPSDAATPSPLNVGIENSRRFRALPVYAALLTEGRPGFAGLVHNMVQLARRLAEFLSWSPDFELLPRGTGNAEPDLLEIFVIVLFRAKDRRLNDVLVERINDSRQVYVSGTTWGREKAVRIAVSSWKVDLQRDSMFVITLLRDIASSFSSSSSSHHGPCSGEEAGSGRQGPQAKRKHKEEQQKR